MSHTCHRLAKPIEIRPSYPDANGADLLEPDQSGLAPLTGTVRIRLRPGLSPFAIRRDINSIRAARVGGRVERGRLGASLGRRLAGSFNNEKAGE